MITRTQIGVAVVGVVVLSSTAFMAQQPQTQVPTGNPFDLFGIGGNDG